MLDLWEDILRPRWKAFKRTVLRIKSKKSASDQSKKAEEGFANNDSESMFVRFVPLGLTGSWRGQRYG